MKKKIKMDGIGNERSSRFKQTVRTASNQHDAPSTPTVQLHLGTIDVIVCFAYNTIYQFIFQITFLYFIEFIIRETIQIRMQWSNWEWWGEKGREKMVMKSNNKSQLLCIKTALIMPSLRLAFLLASNDFALYFSALFASVKWWKMKIVIKV